MLIIFPFINVSFANSAEPPSILIIVPNAPDDLEIEILSEDSYINAKKTDKIIEKYYAFYYRDLKNLDSYVLKISSENTNFEIPLEYKLKTYNNVFMLDLKEQTLTSGKSLSRTMKLVSLRVFLTLIIESIIFLIFGYRQKKSWLYFLVINLFTQGFLNIWLNGLSPVVGYALFALIFGEILVLIAELIAFSILTKEKSRIITFSYVLLANLASLIIGGYAITLLPI